MNRYRIEYTDADDPGCPIFTTHVRAVDKLHAEERFFDSDDQAWKIVSIARVDERNK
jgi:hypothetical protein